VVLVEHTELQELRPLVEVVLLKQLELQILEAVVVDMIILQVLDLKLVVQV
jgi:hypothetical protein